MNSQIDLLNWYNFPATSVITRMVHMMTNAAAIKINKHHATTTSGHDSVNEGWQNFLHTDHNQG